MAEKFILKEAWLLNDNGDATMKLTPVDEDTIPSQAKEGSMKEGYGELMTLAIPSKGRARYRLSSILNYCLENNKELEELTDQERAQFIIKEESKT